MTTPTEHVENARKELELIRSAADYDSWHDRFAWGETYLCLPKDQVREIEELNQIARERAMSFTFPIMAG